jgi:hypothetical protein
MVPSSVWKTIGLASGSSAEKLRLMVAVAASLSEPATWALELYLVPAVWAAKPSPTSRTSQTPMTSARRRAENTATRCKRDDTGTSGV